MRMDRWIPLAAVFTMIGVMFGCGGDGGGEPNDPVNLEEFQVNTSTGVRGVMSVAMGPDGRFVVIWDQVPVRGQRFDSNALKVGTEFTVSDPAEGGQHSRVAIGPQGEFVAVWFSGRTQIHGRRFAPDGSPLGPEFTVNSLQSFGSPDVAIGTNGSFFIVWGSIDRPTVFSIRGQRFAADGSKAGPEFVIDTEQNGSVVAPSVEAGPGGTFVVAWGFGRLGAVNAKVQRFAADGSRAGDPIQVTSDIYDPSSLSLPLAVGPTGGFIIVWQSRALSIMAQRYSSDGSKVGESFQVDPGPSGSAAFPSVSIGPDGKFIVVWSHGFDPSVGIQAQRFAADGSKAGAPFQVTADPANLPQVGTGPSGRSIVAWFKYLPDGTKSSIQGRLFVE